MEKDATNTTGSNQNRGTEQNVAGANHGIQVTNNHYYAPPSESSSVPEQKTSNRLGIHIGTTFAECDRVKLEAIVILLREISGDNSIQLIDLQEGSIKLIIEGSEEGLKRIEELFASGELKELEGFEVEEVSTLTEEEEKQTNEKLRLIEAIRTQQITDLREAKLKRAKLILASFSKAYLRRAYLIGVNLIGVNLSGANLSGANLSGANLSGANLSGANLSGVYLEGAIVGLAHFGYNQGISETLKADLIQRGAIFEDSPGDRSAVSSPAPVRR